jgi:hypothetical protein
MEVVPLITMKDRKILNLQEKLDRINQEQILYIHDLDGIEKDKPNLCTFQRLSKTREIWVDSGPRNLGDIVDVFFAGANAITIRKFLFPKVDISKIRELSENKVFADIDFEQKDNDFFYNEFDGLINFTIREKFEKNFKYGELIKYYITKNNVVFTYDSNLENVEHWKYFGITNFLVDLDNFEEFKQKCLLKQK